MRRPRVLTGTLIGVALGLVGAGQPQDLLLGAIAGAIIGGLVEFIGTCSPLDPPSWSR